MSVIERGVRFKEIPLYFGGKNYYFQNVDYYMLIMYLLCSVIFHLVVLGLFIVLSILFKPLMHNVYNVFTLPEKKSSFALKYLLTCDHFIKVCIKGLNNMDKTQR